MPENILFTAAGRRVSLVKAFISEAKKFQKEINVICADKEPELSSACQFSSLKLPLSNINSANHVSELLRLAQENSVKLIIPLIDTELELYSKNKELFQSNGIELLVSDHEFVKSCADKRLTQRIFERYGIDYPKLLNKKSPIFPLFVKPYDGSLSKDTYYANDFNELKKHHIENDKFLFFEYIDAKKGFHEYTADLYYDKKHNLKCAVPRHRIETRGGEISKGITKKNNLYNFIVSNLSRLEGAIGCITFQFFYSERENKILGIEINPRFGGGYPLSYAAGANFPNWIIKEYLFNDTVDFFEEWEEDLLMLRYDEAIYRKSSSMD